MLLTISTTHKPATDIGFLLHKNPYRCLSSKLPFGSVNVFYPEEAFSHFRSQGVPKVICEEKHMGSRAIVVICKDEESVKKHFGIQNEGIGIVYTRTGRRFFNNSDLEQLFLKRIKEACNKAEFWNEFDTEWACFDCELMPWSEKAQDLLKNQYSAVGSAGIVSLSETIKALEQTSSRQDLEKDFELPIESAAREFDPELVLKKMVSRKNSISKYISAYQQYCWPVDSIDDLKLAPFHLLATNRKVHIEKDHEWHMNKLFKICAYDKELLQATQYKIIDTTDEESFKMGCKWWEEITKSGGEGFVIIEPMTVNYYFLQYYIYTLAIDTYLKSRLSEYSYEKHFGGIFYIFLRGVSDEMDGTEELGDNSKKSYGVYFDKPDKNVIKQLSRELIQIN